MTRRRRLGQHYLIDAAVVGEIVRQIPTGGDRRILEIGTGRGILTSELSKITRNLEAIEIDRENYQKTNEVLRDFPSVRLKLGDAFAEDALDFDVLVSSLPYSESSRFVEWLTSRTFSKAIVILQEDFVNKLMARPGNRNYRAVSVIAQCSFRVEIVRRVERSSFEPQPRVNSLLVAIYPISRLEADLLAVIKKLFSVKKRRIGVALKVLKMRPTSIVSDMKLRVYQIEPDRLRQIAEDVLADPSGDVSLRNPIKL
jgi:16S rRNA (adenine1518-N6/adenine1519-N6)-dimethyltransferase